MRAPRRIQKILLVTVCLFVLLALASALVGCSPLYVMRAAYEESKILLRRERIQKLVDTDAIDQDTREKLRVVLQARQFAESLGMEVGDSYSTFSEVDKEVLAWVLLASDKYAFEPYTWWYPIVGSVPYKGYFDKDDAIAGAQSLEKKGYETWVRGTEAFSTLGWFSDPLLSTTIRHSVVDVVNTVLHELFHQTVWIPGQVDFNESAANFVGTVATIQFFEEQRLACDTKECEEVATKNLAEANESLTLELAMSETLMSLHSKLTEFYLSTPRDTANYQRNRE